MKKHIKHIVLALSLGMSMWSCNYLDISPEQGLDEQQVFSTLENYKAYFNNVYNGQVSSRDVNIMLGYPLYIDFNDRRFTWYSLTDMSDGGRLIRCQQIKAGALGANAEEWTTTLSRRPISTSMFRIIRVANKSIENIGMLTDAKQQEIDDLLGQAYFVRAFAHFVLCRTFGGMPYIDHSLGADDSWDMTRLSANETYRRCAADLETAYDYLVKAGKVRRDAFPGQDGHLTHSEMTLPNGVACKALRGRCLLYGASKLNNVNGKQDWIDAAEACAEALTIAQEQEYELLDFSDWSSNFYGTKYTNEAIWSYPYGPYKGNNSNLSATLAHAISNYGSGSGDCPTQNCVDLFETKWGDPIRTEQERAAAITANHYLDQDPYANRDPRFYKTILYDGCPVQGATGGVNIHYDPSTNTYPQTKLSSVNRGLGIAWGSNDTKGFSNTGYYAQKRWNGQLGSTGSSYYQSDPLIRMAELYLNYAEAVNEAYGPTGSAKGQITAIDALNMIRERAGMPNVLDRFTASADALRDRIRNERNVEFAFEGHHYYFDIRRWKIAPQTMTQPLMGMYIEKVPVSAEYPKGRKYTRQNIPSNRQSTWKEPMYYLPFPAEEANKMKNFVNNEIW